MPGVVEIYAGSSQPTVKLVSSGIVQKAKTLIKGKDFVVE
jgi:hypothetical protein